MNFLWRHARLKPDNVGSVSRTEKLMAYQIKNKQRERERCEVEVFFSLFFAQFIWFLFSALTDASETDQFLFDSNTTTNTHTLAFSCFWEPSTDTVQCFTRKMTAWPKTETGPHKDGISHIYTLTALLAVFWFTHTAAESSCSWAGLCKC